jgi:hypothetical protein
MADIVAAASNAPPHPDFPVRPWSVMVRFPYSGVPPWPPPIDPAIICRVAAAAFHVRYRRNRVGMDARQGAPTT